ncbi:DUF4274 domain-containing protein [Winogradskyella luteola]|uniref:DUF4274 domain-containing protein n=1 Tax=Winogradskyella luteola TaxID=2828330 RepID=A0A9X1F7P2_9FLAO|nr:DUF4274 domain-containing protein [Winogradskyella luteola]MBV7267978.1 DUF4274 domain-containing protein [Winogradskyella luteola]
MEHSIWNEFLNSASQGELYHSLMASNWDDNEYLLDWLKENPKIDKAIILAAYWMSEPYFAKQFKNADEVEEKESWYSDDFDFTEDIEKRYCSGFYKLNELECDPKNIELREGYDKSADRTIIDSDLKRVREIPKVMFEKLNGKRIGPIDHTLYTNGLPNSYYRRIEELFERYEIE